MYASFANHIVQLAHYIFVFALLFFAIPRLFFKSQGSWQERFWQDYLKMVLILIIMGYLLVILRLYEILSLSCIFLFIYFYGRDKTSGLRRWKSFLVNFQVILYDYADGLIHLTKLGRQWWSGIIGRLRQCSSQAGSIAFWGQTTLTLTVIIYSVYLRFYDALKNAAPSMSDAYVVLAWLKYIDRKILFHDGIYPQGFHIYLDFLYKLSGIDALYVLNYSGPLHSLLITFSLYYVVKKLTGHKGPAFVSAISYGLLGQYFISEWMRQAASNSQEFAFIFIFPALYFYILYIKESREEYLRAGLLATVLVGLVHSLAFAFLGLGMGVLIFTALLTDYRGNLQKVMRLVVAGLFAVLCSVIPLGLGLLMGKSFYAAAAQFLVGENAVAQIPALRLFDWLAFGALFLLSVFMLVFRKKAKENIAFSFLFFYGVGSLMLYLFGGVVTKNIVISSRAGELWSLVIPVCLGMGWYALTQLFKPLSGDSRQNIVLLVLVVYIFTQLKPQPILPYKMEPNSYVEQYLRISSTLRPTEWMIVSQSEGYSLAYGKGYHMMLTDFLLEYNPNDQVLTDRKGNGLETQDIFIYQEKIVYRGIDTKYEPQMEEIYQRREQEKEQARIWIEEYNKSHNNSSEYYEDEFVRIVRINQPLDREEVFKTIWE